MRGWMLRLAGIALAVVMSAGAADAQQVRRVKAGSLNCDISGGLGFIIGSQKSVQCVFTPDGPGRPEYYVGTISKFGLDIGATAGGFVAGAFGLDPATGAALGLVGTLAGCANTPISASIMAIELFGAPLSPYAAVTCIVSFLMVGHRSVYPSQILAVTKSASLRPDLGRPLDDLSDVTVTSRDESVLGIGKKIIARMRKPPGPDPGA